MWRGLCVCADLLTRSITETDEPIKVPFEIEHDSVPKINKLQSAFW